MKRAFYLFTLPVLAVLAASPRAAAQSSGLFGNRTLGGSVGEGTRSLTGTPGDRLAQQQSDAGQVSGNERFLRQNRQPGQFVGADSGDSRNFFTQAANAASAQRQSQASRRGQNNSSSRRNSTSRRNQVTFRRQLSVGFAYTPPAPTALSARVEKWLSGIDRISRSGPITVRFAGSKAVLRGKVASAYDRDLVAQLVRLEPGIGDVQNEIVVVSEIPSNVTDGPGDSVPVPKYVVPELKGPQG